MEEWRKIPGYGNRYSASSEGRIRNDKTGRIMKTKVNTNGQECVMLSVRGLRYNCRVSRLVCLAFYGEPENDEFEAVHLDGKYLNNRPENLQWMTRRDSINLAFSRGTRVPRTRRAVRVVETGEVFPSIREAARELDLWPECIRACLKGKYETTGGYHFEEV